jgi:hypothetical protein
VDSVDAEIPFYRVAIHHASEGEHVARFGSEDDVTDIDRALQASRLVGTFEMTGDGIAILLELDQLRGGFPIVAFRIDGPVARHIRRRPLLGELLGNRCIAQGQQ